jgi:hypothetical protein
MILWNKSLYASISSDITARNVCASACEAALRSHELVVSVSSAMFPRLKITQALAHVIQQQPRLGKDAASVLVDVGQAIHASATTEEINLLLRTTMAQEAYLRHSCLQALQAGFLSLPHLTC